LHESTYPRVSIAALSLLVLVAFGVSLYAMSVLLTEEAAGADFSISVLSAGFGGAAVVAGILAPFVGRLADNHSVRWLMLAGSVLGGLAMASFAASTRSWQVLASFLLLLGPATALTLYEPAFVAVGQWVGTMKRNHAIAFLAVVAGLAGPIFVPLTGFMLDHWTWRTSAVVLGAVYAVTGAVAVVVFPAHSPASDLVEPLPRVRWRRFFDDRRLLFLSIAVVLVFSAMNSVFFHRVAVFEEQGFAVATVALLAGLSGFLTFPGRYLMPRLTTHVASTTQFTIAGITIATSMAFAIIGSPYWVMIAFFVVFGLGFGFMLPTRPVIMDTWYAGADFGAVMGKQWSAAAVAGGLAPWLVGVVRDATGSYTIPLLGLTAMVILAVGALAVAIRVGRPHPEP
jgi:predicted MFS family arabinose efflux permease